MSYCEVADVEARFKNLNFTATTQVTLDQVTEWIDDNTNYINAKIRTRYSTPVTVDDQPEAFSILKKICTLLTAAEVEEVLRDSQPLAKGSDSKNGSKVESRATRWRKQADKDLEAIEKGDLVLYETSSSTTTRFYNSNVANDRKPVFSCTEKRDLW